MPLSIEGTIGPHRRWACACTSLAEVKRVRAGLGGTVNDVVLAAITKGFRELLASRMAGRSAHELEARLNAAGVPAARVRSLREFTREAVDTGLLEPVVLGQGAAQARTPGLGWRVRPGSAC